ESLRETSEVFELADESYEAVAGWLAAHRWGDGLPIVPPTPARVDAMIVAAGGRADELLGTVPPRFGVATVGTVAVNAVVAGCPAEVFPVVVAAVRALLRPEVNLRGVQATTHPVAPVVIVHGEAVDGLGFNAGLGTFGPGCTANATVGRAVRLVLLHVGGGYPGDGDASTQGGPAKYTYCFAENAAQSPWPGYHRSRGVDAASAVTVHCGEGPHNFHDMESDSPGPILDKAASVMATLGVNNAPISEGEYFVVLGPEHASTIAMAGWSREDVQSYLFQKARLPRGVLRRAFETVRWEPWMMAVEDDNVLLPMTADADHIRVLVAGGAGKHSCVIPSWGVTRSATVPL